MHLCIPVFIYISLCSRILGGITIEVLNRGMAGRLENSLLVNCKPIQALATLGSWGSTDTSIILSFAFRIVSVIQKAIGATEFAPGFKGGNVYLEKINK